MTVAPVAPAPSKWRKILNGVLAAATSAAAVKEEKSLAAIVVTGLLLSVGASAGLVSLATQIINSL